MGASYQHCRRPIRDGHRAGITRAVAGILGLERERGKLRGGDPGRGNQGEVIPVGIQLEIGMELPNIAVLPGGPHDKPGSRLQVVGGENPLARPEHIIGQAPPGEIYDVSVRIVDFDPVPISPVLILQSAVIVCEEFRNNRCRLQRKSPCREHQAAHSRSSERQENGGDGLGRSKKRGAIRAKWGEKLRKLGHGFWQERGESNCFDC